MTAGHRLARAAALAGLATLLLAGAGTTGQAQGPPIPGRPAPAEIVGELRATLARTIQRFDAKDLPGVMSHVSEQYHTGALTKPTLRAQLLALFELYDEVRAQVRIDEVRLVGPHAWVYSSGEVSGQLPMLGRWLTLFSWAHELEVARREGGTWRLYGYQQ